MKKLSFLTAVLTLAMWVAAAGVADAYVLKITNRSYDVIYVSIYPDLKELNFLAWIPCYSVTVERGQTVEVSDWMLTCSMWWGDYRLQVRAKNPDQPIPDKSFQRGAHAEY